MVVFDQHLVDVLAGFKKLRRSNLADRIDAAIDLIVPSLRQNLPLLVCGNGGSAADALHISGELVGRFLTERKALNVICLSANVAILTAWANDYDFDSIFARQVEAHGASGGVLLCISTSGNSKNMRGGSGWLDSLAHSLSGAWRIVDYAAVCRAVRFS